MKAAVITGEGTPVAQHVEVVDDWGECLPGHHDVVVKSSRLMGWHGNAWFGSRVSQSEWFGWLRNCDRCW